MLTTLINIGVFLIAILHCWIFIIEMFLWQKPYGLKTFKIDAEFAKSSATLAANQGLYNLFLSAGLFWSLVTEDPFSLQLKIFFLVCVFIAGLYAGITANRKIFFIQGLPALIFLILLVIVY